VSGVTPFDVTRPQISKPLSILGTGTALPERVLTNADLEKMVETNDEWIVERTGIKERRIAAEGTSTSTLAAEALKNAASNAGMEVGDLDTIIVATSTPDTVFPSTACWTQKALGIKGAAALDVSAGCTGWLYALELAANLLAGGTGKRIGVVGAEVMSRVIDWEDRSTCVLFGDGAGAVVIEKGDGERGVLASNWGADGNLAPILYQPAGGTQMPATAATVAEKKHTVHMEGRQVFRHAVGCMAKATREAIAEAGIDPTEVDLLIPHQANTRIISATGERTGVPTDRVYVCVERYGNISAATIPIALHDAIGEGRLERDQIVAFTAFGTGLTWAASVLRY
jgi:3-oxoacyl-[acyl-carrier-protein] synthase-3